MVEVGDRIKVVNNEGNESYFSVGSVGVVQKDDDDIVYVLFDEFQEGVNYTCDGKWFVHKDFVVKLEEKQMNIVEINEMISELNPSNKTEAEQMINDLVSTIGNIEDKLAEIGVEYQIDIYLGEYGSGRYLQLEDCDDGWDDWRAGQWVASSSTC